MANDLIRKLAFFRDCLEAETQAQALWNIRNSKSELLRDVKPEVITKNPAQISVSDKYTSSLSKVLDRYWREKRLLLGRFFIVAYHDISSFGGSKRKRKICCPIIYFPCEFTSNDMLKDGKILPNFERAIINPAAKQFFKYYDIEVDEQFDVLLQLSKQPNVNEAITEVLSKLSSLLTAVKPTANISLASENSSTSSLVKELGAADVYFVDLSTSYIMRKQASAQGNLHELETIIEDEKIPQVLAEILNDKKQSNRSASRGFWKWLSIVHRSNSIDLPLPVVLSNAQSQVLKNAEECRLSVVMGPPGTGKTYTIASLALKAFTQNKSVLVVSQNQHAVDVVRRKLIDDFNVDPSLTVLGSDEGLSRDVKAQLVELVQLPPGYDNDEIKALKKKLKTKLSERADTEISFLELCEKYGQTIKEYKNKPKSIFSWLKEKHKASNNEVFLNDQFKALESLDDEINILTAKIVNSHYDKTVTRLVSNVQARGSLRAFSKSLTARNAYHQEKYYQSVNYSDVLTAIPFWFSSVSTLHRLLPLERELFDLVIIDEASQCNMSVCLPAIYRSKRAVVVGDTKQLSHVSFVSYDAQQAMFDKYAISPVELSSDFRNNSVLDYALSSLNSTDKVTQLDEHFRSHPKIIEFSNQTFYNGTLKVMTERPNVVTRILQVKEVKGKRVRGLNKVEADAVIIEIERIITQQASLPEEEVYSLGVLSFFSDQAQYLEKRLFDKLSINVLRRHNLRVGTPFSFQGEERDHMLISCCIDEDTSGSSYTYLNRDDVFNVAITRARDFQTLFLSCEPDKINSASKLNDYVKYCLGPTSVSQNISDESSDAFQNEIGVWLKQNNIEVINNYIVAGISVDIMAVYEGRALAIDLLGFEGELTRALTLRQLQLLARAGLNSFLLPYQEWRDHKEKVLKKLLLEIGATVEGNQGDKPSVEVFSSVEETFIKKLTKGISINQLNARFVNANEVRASKQLHLLLDKSTKFEKTLRGYFIPTELTYKRYLNAFNNLLSGCIAKLQQASVASELSLSLIEQQKVLFGNKQYGEEYDDIFAARASLVEEQKKKIKRLLSLNEKALILMDKTTVELNRLDKQGEQSTANSHDILNELTDKIALYKGSTLNAQKGNSDLF